MVGGIIGARIRLCDDLLAGGIRRPAVLGNFHDPARRPGLLRRPHRRDGCRNHLHPLEKMPLWKTADVLAPSIALGSVFGRIGCLLNGCCYGRPTDLPWAITIHQSAWP
jgi:hypothetical protein